jgi:glycosyltransferase involved in cell wall biosynthesis
MRYFKGKIPVYFRGDSHLLDEKHGWRQILRRIFLRWVYSHVDTAFYVGTQNKAYFLKHGMKEKQLFFAPHAIDNARFADPEGIYEAQARKWRQEMGVSTGQKIILFCGKFENKKDPLLLLRVAKYMQDRKELVFLFVGNGHLESRLKEEAKAMQNVHFMDFQNQSRMPLVYRLGDVLVLPSRGPGETWGLAVNEAMACGRPVIVSDKVGCAVDLVKEGEDGFIFKAGNAPDLKFKLDTLLDSPHMNSGAFARTSLQIVQEWSFQRQLDAILFKFS